jgi:cytochrome c
MSSFEMNKIAGAFLGALLLAIGLSVLSGELFAHKKLVKVGYDLPGATEIAATQAAPPTVPLPDRLAQADAKKGAAGAKACQSCHTFEPAGSAKLGPPLYGVVERQIASVAGFPYSGDLKAKGGNWTFEELDRFLTNPKGFAKGTKMTYAGERDPAKRADIILFLDSLSENPTSLPNKNAMKEEE